MTLHQTIAADIASTLDWWRGAGVDCAFADEPHGWLAEIEPEMTEDERRRAAVPPPAERRVEQAAPQARLGGDPATYPADLAAFDAWWLTQPSLDAGALSARIPPRGAAGAPLMVLVPQPEEADADTLLSGPQGRLLAAILAAIGIPEFETRIAAVLPRHTPLADWPGIAAAGMGDVLAHHLALSRPRAVIAFGGNIPPLLGHDPAQRTADLRIDNQEGAGTPVLFAPDLGLMVQRPGAKAAFWRTWLGWNAQNG
ncbi:MAG: hypothetical protein KGL44_07790 [Sphingomonadales bacterium]|nr:hypothetical protein [Sphingomonadales bacterium]